MAWAASASYASTRRSYPRAPDANVALSVQFGLIYEICRPEPFDGWASEAEIYWQALDQTVLADELGFDYVWAVEHHFLEGYSLSSAPEVFLSAVAQRTERIRVGHGVRLLPPPFNHPARSAEMAAVLDIMSHGRFDFGVGRSITDQELGGFKVDPAASRPMLDEVLPEIVRMWTSDPYPGFAGEWFTMPERQVLPKPLQDPHPPLWMACTQRARSTWPRTSVSACSRSASARRETSSVRCSATKSASRRRRAR